jgi:hypothetical protein
MQQFQIYTHFGRILAIYTVPKDQSHFETYKSALHHFNLLQNSGHKVWFRYCSDHPDLRKHYK